MGIGVCRKCGSCFEGTEEDTSGPDVVCHVCYLTERLTAERALPVECEHEWHRDGTTRHRDGSMSEDWHCQRCGKTWERAL